MVPAGIRPSGFRRSIIPQKKKTIQHSISVRGPKIWNEFLSKEEKEIQSHSIFLRKIKTKLLESENERKYF